MEDMENGDMTTFWLLCAALAGIVAFLIALSLRAPMRKKAEPPAAFDLRVYRDQLKEVDKDLARGVVDAADADRVRAEISRRILAADAAMQSDVVEADARKGAPFFTSAVLFAVLVGGSLLLYRSIGAPGYGDLSLQDRIALAEEARQTRPTQEQAEARLPAYVAPENVSPDYVALVERLRSTVEARPDDLQGHLLLAQNEANLGNFDAAAQATARIIELKGDEATAQDYLNHADMLVLAAGGYYVSPEAETALSRVLAEDPTNGFARYYMGSMLAQTGRPDMGFRIWDHLLREGPADAPWIDPILGQIEDLAFRSGVNYQLPEIGPGRGTQGGPSAADIDAAQDMSPVERMEMIQSMVQGLSDRLSSEGGPVEDWAQLITALGVLGETGGARAVYENAIEVFADDTRALDLLLRAGQRAQVAE